MFENLRIILSTLKQVGGKGLEEMTFVKCAGTVRVDERPYVVTYVDGIWLSMVTRPVIVNMQQAGGEESRIIAWHALNEFFGHIMTDTIGSLGTPEWEKTLNDSTELHKVIEEYKIFLIPNYYFVRRLIEDIRDLIEDRRDLKSIIDSFNEYLINEYKDRPMIFIVIQAQMDDKIRLKMSQLIESMLSYRLAELIGQKISATIRPH